MTEGEHDRFAVVVVALGRDTSDTDRGRIARHRAELIASVHRALPELDVATIDLESYDVDRSGRDPWDSGGVDVLLAGTDRAEFERLARHVVAAADRLSADDGVGYRTYGVRRNSVRPAPHAGVHVFSRGGLEVEGGREAWQARWRQHIDLISEAVEYEPHLLGYEQYHGIAAEQADVLGLDDANGIAHMTYASVDDMDLALSLPDYLAVLRADEERFVNRRGGVRIITTRSADLGLRS